MGETTTSLNTQYNIHNTNFHADIDLRSDDNIITQIFKQSFKANFKITESFFEKLKTEYIPSKIVAKLTILLDRSFTEETVFIDTLKEVIGNEQFVKYNSSILKHTRFKTFNKAKEWLAANEIVTDKFFTIAGNQYKDFLNFHYNTMKIAGMSKPIPLSDILIKVNILKKITSKQEITAQELQEYFVYDSRGFGKKLKTEEGIEVVNKDDKLIVLGKPGAGKTTFLKHITLQMANGLLKEKYIPIMIILKRFSDSNKSLTDFITEQFDECHFSNTRLFIEYLLTEGRCILLFDGLDEVSKDKANSIIDEIQRFCDKYRKNKYVLSCRIAAYNYLFQQFTDVEIADFDDKQVADFINLWFAKDKDTAKACREALENNLPIKELSSIPLLLTLLCLVFEKNKYFPKNKAKLYDRAIDILLNKWDSSRNIQRQQIYESLSTNDKESMFGQIAYLTFQKGQYFLEQHRLEKYITNSIRNISTLSKRVSKIDGEAILKSIETHHGIFVERACEVYSFSHLTFQEYFTAKYIVDNETEDIFKQLVTQNIKDNKWHEIFLSIAGLLENADKFLLLIKNNITTLVNSSLSSKSLFQYFNAIFSNEKLQHEVVSKFTDINTKDPLNRAIKLYTMFEFELAIAQARAGTRPPLYAISLELHLKRCRDIARSTLYSTALIFGYSLDLNYFQELALIFDRSLALPLSKGFKIAYDIAGNLDQAVYLDRPWLRGRTFDRDDALSHALQHAIVFFEDTGNYLYLNLLLIKSIQTECSISNEIQQLLLDEVLLINRASAL